MFSYLDRCMGVTLIFDVNRRVVVTMIVVIYFHIFTEDSAITDGDTVY